MHGRILVLSWLAMGLMVLGPLVPEGHGATPALPSAQEAPPEDDAADTEAPPDEEVPVAPEEAPTEDDAADTEPPPDEEVPVAPEEAPTEDDAALPEEEAPTAPGGEAPPEEGTPEPEEPAPPLPEPQAPDEAPLEGEPAPRADAEGDTDAAEEGPPPEGEGEDAEGEEDTEAEEAPKGDRTPGWFKKGELAAIGSLGLVPWENRVGLRIDVERLGHFFYLALTPTANYTFKDVLDKDLVLSLGVPLRFELLDTRGSTTDERFGNVMRFRVADWDSPQDYAKLIRYITWGRKEDKWYLNINAFRTATIGHGTILKRYNPNLALDIQRVSFEFDGFSDWIGGETYLNNIAPPNMAGALLFIKPLSFIDRENYLLRSFSIGVTGVIDWDAPLVNRLDVFDADDDGRRGEILLGGENQTPQYWNTMAIGWGVDAEMKVYKSEDKTVDIKLYADVSTLNGEVPKACEEWTNPDDRAHCPVLFSNDPVTIMQQPQEIEREWRTSVGGSLGALGRFTLGDDRDHALRTRLELRLYEPNYVPSYFDTYYQVQRVFYGSSSDPSAVNPANQTKIRRILERTGPDVVLGAYAEFSYALWEVFEVALGLQFAQEMEDNAFFIHVGVPKYKWFSFHASYAKHASSLDDLFTTTTNSMLTFHARARLFEYMHLHIEALTPFGIGADNRFEQIFDINMGIEISFGI